MSTSYRTLGTADSVLCGDPSSTSPLTDNTYGTIYTVPSGKRATISEFGFTNNSSAVRTFCVAIIQSADGGSSPTRNGQYRKPANTPVKNGQDFTCAPNWTLAAGDKIVVKADTVANVGFYLHGREDDV